VTGKIRKHGQLEVYRRTFEAAMRVYEVRCMFPREEVYSLTDQVRRSSRSVCANLAEAWRKRRYRNAFIGKLSDAEAEAAETQVRIEFAVRCGYLDRDAGAALYEEYDRIIATLVGMITHSGTWILDRPP
jgi:four helix bundle protein